MYVCMLGRFKYLLPTLSIVQCLLSISVTTRFSEGGSKSEMGNYMALEYVCVSHENKCTCTCTIYLNVTPLCISATDFVDVDTPCPSPIIPACF